MKKLNVVYIDEKTARCFSPQWNMFKNLNTKDDLRKYYMEQKRLESNYAGV